MPEPTAAQRSAYARGMVFVISMTTDPGTNAFLRDNPNAVFRSIVLENQGAGVIAQVVTPMVNGQLGAPPPAVFIPFPFNSQSVAVGTVPPQRWATLDRNTPLRDLGLNTDSTLEAYYPDFFTEVEAQGTPPARNFGRAPGAQPGAQPGAAPTGQPAAPPRNQPFQGEMPDFDRAFTKGLVFQLDFTSNPNLQQYQGTIMQVVQVNKNVLVAVPEASTNLREGVIIFNDKKQRYTFKPGGNYRFASGLQSGQRLWNPQQRGYVTVDTWYPTYFGSPFIGMPYVLCDLAIPVGFAVGMALGCMVDLLTCPFGYNYYCDGYYPAGMYGGRYYGGGWGLGYYDYGYDFWCDPFYQPGFGYFGCGYYGDCYAGLYGYDPVFGMYGGYGGYGGYEVLNPGYDTYGMVYGADGGIMIDGGADFGYADTAIIDNTGFGDNGGVVDGQGYDANGVQVDNGQGYDQNQVDPNADTTFDDQQGQGQQDPGYGQQDQPDYGADTQFDDTQDVGGNDAPDFGGDSFGDN